MRVVALAVMIGLAACRSEKRPSDAIPAEVRRRIAQAIWPENLFDSAGQPERGFVRRDFRPAFSDLSIRRVAVPNELRGVTLFVGTARPSGCADCGSYTYVVAQRDSTYRTLLDPGEIAYLYDWASPAVHVDSLALREFVIAVLRATCFVGCDVRQVIRRADISSEESLFLHGTDEHLDHWSMPRTYSWQRNGGVLVEFALLSAGRGVYAVRADAPGSGRLFLSVSAVASYAF